MEAIRRVLEGKIWVSAAMAERLLQRSVGTAVKDPTRPQVESLTDRELEVFRLIGEGVKTAEIAERLHRASRRSRPIATASARNSTSWMVRSSRTDANPVGTGE